MDHGLIEGEASFKFTSPCFIFCKRDGGELADACGCSANLIGALRGCDGMTDFLTDCVRPLVPCRRNVAGVRGEC